MPTRFDYKAITLNIDLGLLGIIVCIVCQLLKLCNLKVYFWSSRNYTPEKYPRQVPRVPQCRYGPVYNSNLMALKGQ